MPVKDRTVGGTKTPAVATATTTTKKAQATKANANPEIKADASQATQAAPETQAAPAKPEKVLVPKDWQKIQEDPEGKKKLVNQIVFMGELTDYEPGHKEEYFWPNLSAADGLKRIVTAKFPKTEKPDQEEHVKVFGYDLYVDKFGNSAVCRLVKDDEVILNYVSLATVLDVLQDELNPKGEDGKGTCEIPWGTIDQVIKFKRGLKSRMKNLGEDDLPLRASRKKATTETAEGENAGTAE